MLCIVRFLSVVNFSRDAGAFPGEQTSSLLSCPFCFMKYSPLGSLTENCGSLQPYPLWSERENSVIQFKVNLDQQASTVQKTFKISQNRGVLPHTKRLQIKSVVFKTFIFLENNSQDVETKPSLKTKHKTKQLIECICSWIHNITTSAAASIRALQSLSIRSSNSTATQPQSALSLSPC